MSRPAAGSIPTPLGWAGAAVTDRGVAQVVLPRQGRQQVQRELAAFGRMPAVRPRSLQRVLSQLGRYLSGRAVSFGLPLDLRYYSPFQQAVWNAAAAIPYGETRSYAWIAKRIGRPGAARAVGQALGANPVPILIPCHRVVSSTGALGGFSGGAGMKKRLLDLEAHAGRRR